MVRVIKLNHVNIIVIVLRIQKGEKAYMCTKGTIIVYL